ncbi:MAG TPA: thioredoxin domain-containing protein [Bryobacteraceae bacterium]|jgi:protein-disulfide isomerase|nr:thioredoxin domain-containing protein [Bryobacteraceae bacterium]
MRLLYFSLLFAAGTLFASEQADRTVGSPNAPVTLEVWSDFQCPHCAQLHFGAIKQAIGDCVASGKVRIVFRDYILPQMPYSRKAAQYADAASRIGKYERICDTLFRTQQEWGRTGDVEGAVAKDLTPAEMAKVRKILADPKALAEINAEIDADMALARKIPLESTPTMILSGKGKRYPITGDARYDLLGRLIDTIVK